MRRATTHPISIFIRVVFLSTLSLRRATAVNIQRPATENNFYPRSPCGERQDTGLRRDRPKEFLSTLSLRRATTHPISIFIRVVFLSTLSLRRATAVNIQRPATENNFYPRSPCGERQDTGLRRDRPKVFLSTLSLRRATTSRCRCQLGYIHFYPRSPCGERQLTMIFGKKGSGISIHALLAESDLPSRGYVWLHLLFLSTLSLRRATGPMKKGQVYYIISIHALLAESD